MNEPSGRLTPSGSRPQASRWRSARPVALVVLAGVSLYVLLPSLLSVFGSWRTLSHLDPAFAVLVVACVVASFVCLWELERIALGTRAWFPVVAAELSGNALSHVVPSAAPGGALEVSMPADAGLDTGDTVAALTASTVLQWGTTAALPLLALPAVLGGVRIDHRLDVAAYLGAAVLVALLVLGTLAFRDGHAALALLCALRGVGADPRPALVLLAYVAAELLALLPITPGGLGFVEAGLVGMLVVAGVPSAQALAATLLYRLATYWLPLPAGAVAYVLFRRRYPRRGG